MKKPRILPALTAVSMLLANCASAYTLHLPDDLSVIREQAFKGNAAIEGVVLPDGLKRIESEAFADSGLNSIYGSSIYGIRLADDAFDDKTFFHFPYKEGKLNAVCGERAQIDVYAYPLSSSLGELSYASSDESLLTIDSSGEISALGSGNAAVTITESGGASTVLDVQIKKWADVYEAASIAHRGASGYKPDNTISAFKHAIKLNADMIELDVQKTKDGKIICFHDTEVEIGGNEIPVSKLTFQQMRNLNSSICTLEEALKCVYESDIQLQIEIKSSGIEQEVVQLVADAGMSERTGYGSFIFKVLQRIRSADPCANLVYIINHNSTLRAVIEDPIKFDVDAVSVRSNLLSEKRIAQLHLAGKQVYVWTLNDTDKIAYYKNMGVDGIVSDFPDKI